MSRSMSGVTRLKSAVQIIAGSHIVAAGLATYYGNETWYRNVVMPVIHATLDGERAHKAAIWCAKHGLVPKIKITPHDELKTSLWGLTFKNPVGLAAGFDKHGEAVNGLLKMGFGYVEVGSVTPEPQPGNPTPRVFRLKEDSAIINRYGFNSVGHECALKNLQPKTEKGIVGVNLGKNKTSTDDAGDYVKGVLKFSEAADYLVINISSPNTPGLRALQGKENLEKLLKKVAESRSSLPEGKRRPILVKLSPDLTDADKKDIAEVITRPDSGVDGLIISNTTIDRSMKLVSSNKDEVGGLSGAPVRDLSTKTIKDMFLLTGGKVPIVGLGGISSGEDAYKKIRAGASLVQIYSSLAYQGPPVVNKINRELAEILRTEGVKHISEIVGVDANKP